MKQVAVGATMLAVAMLAFNASSARADITWPVDGTAWTDITDLLPAVVPDPVTGFDPSSPNACIAGRSSCVQEVITDLRNVVDPLARTCSHLVIFPLGYLRVTQSELASQSWTPPLFQNPAYINYMDGVFASYYLRAYEHWQQGLPVAPAWQMAFDASKQEKLPAVDDFVMGMDAHILNDLPFVIYQSGLSAADGTSRKGDYDAVNQFVYPVTVPLIEEIERRFDPTISQQFIIPGTTFTPDALYALVAGWREQAWREAEDLAAAPDAPARMAVAQTIKSYAAQVALLIETGTQYPPLSNGAAVRDAYCATHWNDR